MHYYVLSRFLISRMLTVTKIPQMKVRINLTCSSRAVILGHAKSAYFLSSQPISTLERVDLHCKLPAVDLTSLRRRHAGCQDCP